MESRETNNDCSLDLSPNPDSNLFGNREESEEEVQQNQRMVRRKKSDAISRDPVESKLHKVKEKESDSENLQILFITVD